MGMKFSKVASTAFAEMQFNAGILCDSFTPSTGTVGNILGATTGGVSFASNPTYSDFGEDVDNVPAGTKQLKRLDSWDPVLSGSFVTCTAAGVKRLLGAADADTVDETKILPRSVVLEEDFDEIWWVGDYSDVNTGASAGFVAIHLIDALNTTGFQITSSKNGKGTMAFEFHGHYDIEDDDQTPPFEIYVAAGDE